MSSLNELLDAAERGDTKSVVAMLNADASLLHAMNDVNETALHAACRRQRVDVVTQLLERGAHIDARGWLGLLPLHYAVHEPSERSLALARVLLEHGADASQRDDRGYTAFELANENATDDVELHALLKTPDTRLESLRAQLAGHDGVDALLNELSNSGWAAPLRSLASGANITADLAIDRLSAGGNGASRQAGMLKLLRIADSEFEEVGDDFAATQNKIAAIEQLAHTVHAVDQLRTAFGKKKPLELAKGPWNPDEACVRDTREVLEAFRASPLAEPLRNWLSQRRLSGATTDWVHRYFAYAASSASPTH